MEKFMIECSLLLFSDEIYFNPKIQEIVFPKVQPENFLEKILKVCDTEEFEFCLSQGNKISFQKKKCHLPEFLGNEYEVIFNSEGSGILFMNEKFYFSPFLKKRTLPSPIQEKLTENSFYWFQKNKGKILNKRK